MSAEPSFLASNSGPYEVIHLGGEAAAIVPLAELRRLQALERHATAAELDAAEAEAASESYEAWVGAGRPGAVSHEEAMAALLRGSR